LKAGNIQVDPFRDFVETIVSGDSATAIRLLDASPLLAKERAAHGATRQAAKQNFFDQILHYMYEAIPPCISRQRHIKYASLRS
jgi:hypothetical protein